MHGQDFLPVYYLVLRPDVSGRVALWREIVWRASCSPLPKGKMAIFCRLPSLLSLIFLVESRYKLITKGMCDFKFFFLKLIIVGCVDLSYTHMYFGKILFSRDIEE